MFKNSDWGGGHPPHDHHVLDFKQYLGAKIYINIGNNNTTIKSFFSIFILLIILFVSTKQISIVQICNSQ